MSLSPKWGQMEAARHHLLWYVKKANLLERTSQAEANRLERENPDSNVFLIPVPRTSKAAVLPSFLWATPGTHVVQVRPTQLKLGFCLSQPKEPWLTRLSKTESLRSYAF